MDLPSLLQGEAPEQRTLPGRDSIPCRAELAQHSEVEAAESLVENLHRIDTLAKLVTLGRDALESLGDRLPITLLMPTFLQQRPDEREFLAHLLAGFPLLLRNALEVAPDLRLLQAKLIAQVLSLGFSPDVAGHLRSGLLSGTSFPDLRSQLAEVPA